MVVGRMGKRKEKPRKRRPKRGKETEEGASRPGRGKVDREGNRRPGRGIGDRGKE